MTGERILMLVSFANLGGAQIAALRLARGLRDRGHDPRVIFLYEQNPIPAPDHPYEVLVKRPSLGVSGYALAMRALARVMRQEKPHRVLTFMPLASALGQAAAFLAGAERRVVSHRVPVWSIRPSLNVLDRLWAWLGIYTDVVAVSEGVRASCRGYPARLMRRTVVVHNGLFGWHASALGREEARSRLGIAPDRLALVAVGRLAAQKNYPLMLRVMQKLDGAVLLIAGDGPDSAALAHAATTLGVADRVRFLGAVERSAIPDLLVAADVFVQPSTFEGQSNAILEALQAGLPIVAHDIPEQRETIADPDGTSAGALVPLDDVKAWVAAIERLRADRAAMQAAREVASRRARLFGFDRMVAGFEKVLIA